MENTHNINIPGANLIGVGSLKDLPTELIRCKLKKTLIVTDKNILSLGYVEMVETILKNLFISYDIFDGVLHPNPTISFVEEGLSYFDKGINLLKRDYDFIISIGGASNHDCAKGIAIVATNGGSISDYEGYKKLTKPALPLIAINTTAGGASEVTMFTIITDETRKVKMTIGDPRLTPIISVNDPMLMTTMPKEVTATSGIDIISHAIEAYTSTEASPITDSLALGSLRLVFQYLKRAYDNGNDLEAREQMMFANIKAGIAFNSAGLGLVHAIAHQIGGVYKKIHGTCNVILLPYVLEFNSETIPDERILNIAEAIGVEAMNKSDAVIKIMDAIKNIASSVGLPIKLMDLEVNEEDFFTIAQNSLKDICALTNPRQSTIEDIENILRKAY